MSIAQMFTATLQGLLFIICVVGFAGCVLAAMVFLWKLVPRLRKSMGYGARRQHP